MFIPYLLTFNATHIPQPQQTPHTAVHVTPSEVNIVNVVYSWSTFSGALHMNNNALGGSGPCPVYASSVLRLASFYAVI